MILRIMYATDLDLSASSYAHRDSIARMIGPVRRRGKKVKSARASASHVAGSKILRVPTKIENSKYLDVFGGTNTILLEIGHGTTVLNVFLHMYTYDIRYWVSIVSSESFW
jgi:hypothetical protein